MKVLIRRFLDVARTFGVARTLRLAPGWMLTRRYFVFAWDLRQPLPQVAAPEGVSLRILTPAAWPVLGGMDPRMSPGEIGRRVAEGQECITAWVDGVLAYYRWQSTQAVFDPHIRKTLRPGTDDIIIVDVFTSPRFRGRGIGEFVSQEHLVRARALGRRRAWWLVAWWNVPALRIARHPEYRRCVGTVGYVNLGLFRRPFVTGDVRLAPDGVRVDPGCWSPETG